MYYSSVLVSVGVTIYFLSIKFSTSLNFYNTFSGASKHRLRMAGDGRYWLDDVNCEGNESNLFECGHREIGQHNCGRNERAGVNCLSMLTLS